MTTWPLSTTMIRSTSASTLVRWVATMIVRPCPQVARLWISRRSVVLVQGRGGFVEQQDVRLTDQQARQQQRLALATRQAEAAFQDQVIHAGRTLAYEIQGAGDLQCGDDFLIRGLPGAHDQVLAQAAVEQPRILREQTDVAAHVGRVYVSPGPHRRA